MTQNGTVPNLDSLSLSDADVDDAEDLFASPSVQPKKRLVKSSTVNQKVSDTAHLSDDNEDALAAHEASLHRELASLRNINQVISGITASLEKARTNMDAVSATVTNASTLLTTWTRILSQTEHNQRLILNPDWQGATQDIADGENAQLRRRQEQQQREADELRKAQEKEAERLEEERRTLSEGSASRTGRGRGRSFGRGTGRSAGTGHVSAGAQGRSRGSLRGSTSSSRTSGGSGRGSGLARGKGRG